MSASKQGERGKAETPNTAKKATVEGQKALSESPFHIYVYANYIVIGGGKPVKYEANAELIAEAFNVATETGLTPRQLQKARDESYGIGVTAGKREGLKYTPEERERYGKWAAEGKMCSLLVEQKKELLEALDRAKEIIAIWHGGVAWPEYQHSPEMKQINAALALK